MLPILFVEDDTTIAMGVEYSLKQEAFQMNALYAEIIVSDDGGGIASRDIPHIFNRFYRGENAGENGVGIGLALAKSIFTAQGGDISVRSQSGLGTSFEIRLFRGVV